MDNLIIEGFIGSGKGAVARAIAKKLSLPCIDIDKKVSERLRMTTPEIYDRFGVPYYRAMETLILDELTRDEKRHVIVLGSGLATMPQNAPYLKQLGRVYYLKMKEAGLLAHMRRSQKHAWSRSETWDEQVEKLLKEREPWYRKTADVTIDANDKSADAVADEIIADQERASGN